MRTVLEVGGNVEGDAGGCSAANEEDLEGKVRGAARACHLQPHRRHHCTFFCDEDVPPNQLLPLPPCPPPPACGAPPNRRESSLPLTVSLFGNPEFCAKLPKNAWLLLLLMDEPPFDLRYKKAETEFAGTGVGEMKGESVRSRRTGGAEEKRHARNILRE